MPNVKKCAKRAKKCWLVANSPSPLTGKLPYDIAIKINLNSH